MYRLAGPKLIIFIPIILVGIVAVSIAPNYYETTRVLSLSALILGEAGLSFIPILALYPKANPFQAATLAIIYFFSTFIVCFSASGINAITGSINSAFNLKEEGFVINIFALFAANIFSLIALILNFKLIYDEELTKQMHEQTKIYGYKKGFSFFSMLQNFSFQKPLLKRPSLDTPRQSFSGSTTQKKDTPRKKETQEFSFDDDFIKPFEFEPEISTESTELPEESSGKLYAPEVEKRGKESDFFDTTEEDINPSKISDEIEFSSPGTSKTTTTKPTQASPFPPSNIKNDLQEIFEQYSSLNAVKKITAIKTEKLYPKKKQQAQKKETPQISVKIEGDVHEATFRQIGEEEKLEEIKENLKKELGEQLKSELKKELGEKESEEFKAVKEEEREFLQDVLTNINKELTNSGALFLNQKGQVLAENWSDKRVLHDSVDNTIVQLFNTANGHFNKTNQGELLHILLESESGTLALGELENKILTVHTAGTGEGFSGQILRALSTIEREEN